MENKKKGLLIVVSGPAGSGKGTVLSHLLKEESYRCSVSATTRAPRPGEQNAQHPGGKDGQQHQSSQTGYGSFPFAVFHGSPFSKTVISGIRLEAKTS